MIITRILPILMLGMAAGFLNTVAGGGSLLTMPALIFMGLPPAMANGTNRIALVVQNIVATLNFRQKGFFDWKLNLMLAIPAVIGSILGANQAISLPGRIFNRILAVIMIIVLGFILRPPRKKTDAQHENLKLHKKIIAMIAFFIIGAYGGFIQAGIGFIIIASLTAITGLSLVEINSIKVFVILAYMLSSFAIFVYRGQVDWPLGLTLAVGNGIGGWLGTNFAITGGDKWIRIILVVVVTLMAVKLFISF